MHMTTGPKLSKDLQRHLGRELGLMVEATTKEPLTSEMERLLDRLREGEKTARTAGRRPMGRPNEA